MGRGENKDKCPFELCISFILFVLGNTSNFLPICFSIFKE